MPKFVFDVTYAVRADTSERALLRLMSALDGVEHYDGGDIVEFVYVEGGEEAAFVYAGAKKWRTTDGT